MSLEQDANFFKNLRLLLIGLAVIGAFAAVLAGIFGGHETNSEDRTQALVRQLAPVGDVYVEGRDTPPKVQQVAAASPGSGASGDKGAHTYETVCAACHGAGIAGAPKYGDAAAWSERFKQGFDTLASHALNGFQGSAGVMPARGGRSDLSDEEVKSAIWHMLSAAGIKNPAGEAAPTPESAPAAPSGAADAASVPAPASAGAATMADASVNPEHSARGKSVFEQACTACHTPGAAGAPKLGDHGAWAPRIAQGSETLYKHALEGFLGSNGMMPPKGGRPDLADDDVKAAVDYMVTAAQ